MARRGEVPRTIRERTPYILRGEEPLKEVLHASDHDGTQPDVSYEADGSDSLALFMHQLGRYPLLTAAQEVELAKRIERGDLEAKERMINSNLRLVVHNARRYVGRGVPF